VWGDRYAGQWVRQAFREVGVAYRDAELDKSAIYVAVEPLFSQGRIRILDHPQLARELKLLERRPRAGGRTLVDHPSGRYDDHANALALAAAVAMRAPGLRASEVFGPDGFRVLPAGAAVERTSSPAPTLPVRGAGIWREF
jgi:hypothetical protein